MPAINACLAPAGRILVVDDEEAILRAYARILRRAGYEVTTTPDAEHALGFVTAGCIDLVVTDINMPTTSGLDLLRAVRAQDPDLPVILMTGVPRVETAAEAMEHGVLRYLMKPVDSSKLLEGAAQGVRLSRSRRHGPQPGLAELERALARAWMAYQPIVSWKERRIFAFEALLRSEEPGLQAGVLVETAERHGQIEALGRRVRSLVAPTALASDALFFVNLHPAELFDEELYDPAAPLAACAARVVFEITERRSLGEIDGLAGRLERLRSLGYRFALDDLGAGYAGLASVAELTPDVIKLDMSLVRGVHESRTKQKLVASMASLARELAIPLVAEGVETRDERRTLLRLGCDLLQGYLFARPGRPLPEVPFERLGAETVSAPSVAPAPP